MSRLTKQDTETNVYRIIYRSYGSMAVLDMFEQQNAITGIVQKLGQLEDVMDKYGIEDISVLHEILEVHKFLLNHDYRTLPKKDFDLLFKKIEDSDKKLRAFEIIVKKDVQTGVIPYYVRQAKRGIKHFKNPVKAYNDFEIQNEDYKLTEEEFDLLKEVLL